jgi:urease accessory protein
MPRAISVLAAANHGGPAADTVILDYRQRSPQKISVVSVKGATIEIDLREPKRLHNDDVLVLDDGKLLEVVAAPEPLFEARAADAVGLSRLAWHLGDRHLPVQVLANRIRARREPDVEALLVSLGAKLIPIEAPFEPEGGAYALSHGHGHDHVHDHHHGHGHDH